MKHHTLGDLTPQDNGQRPTQPSNGPDAEIENPMVNYARLIKETSSQHYNVADQYKNNTIEENIEICKKEKRNFSVGAINITGELNIGMMIRSACLFGAEKFYIFGRKKFDKRSTVGAEKYINIVQYTYDAPIDADEQLLLDLKDLWQTYHFMFACEQGGIEIGKTAWNTLETTDGYHTPLFLFGSESHGIPQNVLEWDKITKISIPQRGVMRSFNVSSAMNIICWDYLKETCL